MEEKDQKNEELQHEEEVLEEGGSDASEADELKDRLLRMAAEFDNYKKRIAREIEGSKELGRADVIMKLLPMLDEFELALNAFGAEDKHQKGIAMIYSNFIGMLKGFGLVEIEAKGKSDPYRHEVVLTRESDEEEGTIIEVVRKGYMMNNIMLRPTSVIIARNDVEGKTEKDG